MVKKGKKYWSRDRDVTLTSKHWFGPKMEFPIRKVFVVEKKIQDQKCLSYQVKSNGIKIFTFLPKTKKLRLMRPHQWEIENSCRDSAKSYQRILYLFSSKKIVNKTLHFWTKNTFKLSKKNWKKKLFFLNSIYDKNTFWTYQMIQLGLPISWKKLRSNYLKNKKVTDVEYCYFNQF